MKHTPMDPTLPQTDRKLTPNTSNTGTHRQLTLTPAVLQWHAEGPQAAEFGDRYFHPEDGAGESRYVFLQHNQLPERFSKLRYQHTFIIVETGFGTGLNCLEAIRLFKATTPPHARLQIISCDKHPLLKRDLQQASLQWPHLAEEYAELIAHYPPLVRGTHTIRWSDPRIQLLLWWEDIHTMLEDLHIPVDAWFLDGFAPSRNPHMWSEELFNHMQRLAKPKESTFATFTAASAVRRGLAAVGFEITRAKGYGHKRHMLHGIFDQAPEANPRHKPASKNPPWFHIESTLGLPASAPSTRQLQTPKRLAVIGAGIAGLSTAFLLKEAGYEVTLYDAKNDAVQAGSGNPQAVLYTRLSCIDQAHNRFHNGAFQCAINQLERLQRMPGFAGFTPSGSLEKLEAAQIEQWAQDLKHCFLDADWITLAPPSQQDLMPTEALLSFPRAGWFAPKTLAETLIKLADIKTYFGYQITALSRLEENSASQLSASPIGTPHIDDRPQRITPWQLQWQKPSDQSIGQHTYDGVILCCPASIKNLLPDFITHLRPLPGQVNQVPVTETSAYINQVLTGPCSILPAHDGRHTIGSTYRPGSTDESIQAADTQKNLDQLSALSPALAKQFAQLSNGTLPARAATRWNTRDYLPLIGPIPDWDFFTQTYGQLGQLQRRTWHTLPPARYQPNLWVNTGHGSRGFTQSWIAAELLLAYVSGAQPALDQKTRNALHPARYFMRALRKQNAYICKHR